VRITRSILVAVTLWLAAACGSSAPIESVRSIDNEKVAAIEPEGIRVQWRKPIVRSLVEAVQSQKVVIMYFHLDSCPYCAYMERTTFQTVAVVGKLNKHYVPIWLNIEEHWENAAAVGVEYTPAVVFLTPSGNHIVTIQGLIPPSDFLRILDAVDDYAERERQGNSIRAFLREPQRKQYRL
jgi:thioredoxin-related protein